MRLQRLGTVSKREIRLKRSSYSKSLCSDLSWEFQGLNRSPLPSRMQAQVGTGGLIQDLEHHLEPKLLIKLLMLLLSM